MRTLLVLVAMLWSVAAFAQAGPPTVGGKPLVQVKPRGAPSKPPSIAERLQACLDIEDESKGRLDCYDAIIPPKMLPSKLKPKAPAARVVADCKFVKEEDERLTCFNGFAESIPKLPKT